MADYPTPPPIAWNALPLCAVGFACADGDRMKDRKSLRLDVAHWAGRDALLRHASSSNRPQ